MLASVSVTVINNKWNVVLKLITKNHETAEKSMLFDHTT